MNFNFNDYKNYIVNKKKDSFRIQDLKNGDVVLFNDGDVEIAMPSIGALICEDGYDKISEFTEDLKYIYDSSLMIMEVRRPREPFECSFSAFKNNSGVVVYQRDKEEKIEKEKEYNCTNLTKEDYLKMIDYIEKNNKKAFENKILSLINNASNEETKYIINNGNGITEKFNGTKIYCTSEFLAKYLTQHLTEAE